MLKKKEKVELPSNPMEGHQNAKGQDPIISIQHIDIEFGAGRKRFKAVSDVSFDIYPGETVSLVGESGSGKTTIGRAIVRINPLAAGAIYYNGRRISGKVEPDRELIAKAKEDVVRTKAEYQEAKAKVQQIKKEIAPNYDDSGLKQELLGANNELKEKKAALVEKQKKGENIESIKNEIDELNVKIINLRNKIKKGATSPELEAAEKDLDLKETAYFDAKREVAVAHNPTKEIVRNIQMIFQDPAASLNERATIDYSISEGLYNFHLYKDEADRVEKVKQIVEEVGLLPEHLTRYPHEFSGGQRQRVGIARSVVMEPKFIVADEPISALDVSIRAQVLNLLRKFQKEQGLTYLFIAHDLSIVRFISDRIAVIHLGKIVEIAETEELFAYPLHPYTKSLLSAIPIPDPILERNKTLFVYDPSVHDYSIHKPELVDLGNGHLVYGNEEEIANYKAIRFKK